MNLRLPALLLVSVLFACVGNACSCAPPMPGHEDIRIQEEVKISDIVFRGKIIAHRGGAAVFEVYEYWKGNLQSVVELEWRRGDRGDCEGFWPDDLKVGNELLVFATKRRGIYRTNICRPTGLASESQRVLRILGRAKQNPARQYLWLGDWK